MKLSPIEIGYIMIALFLLLMFLKMPIGVTMILTGFLGLLLIRGLPGALSGLSVISWRQGINYTLIVIPLFTWMGALASYGGISKDAFTSVYKWVGHLPGGLAMAVTWACAAFGAVCGSHVATALTMCSAALPEMRRYKYDDSFSLGCISAAGTLGIMIPPSTAFIIYGFVTETSIGQLFIAGILPGILMTILFCIQIYIQCKMNPRLGPVAPDPGWLERFKSIKGLWAIVLVFILVMGGIYLGVFTPTEGAACGCFAVFIIALANRQLTWKGFVQSLRETMVISAMIMLMIIGAMIFGAFITTSELPGAIANLVTQSAINKYLIMAVILIVYMIAGFIMDIYAVLIVTLPIFFPIATALGFDPVHFGVLSVVTVMMGAITPPFGIVVFAVGGMNREVPLFAIFRGALPFFYTMILALVILLFIPSISTILPDLMVPFR